MVELSSKTFRVAIAAMAITLSVDAAMAENANAPRTLKEGHGLSLDIGSKKLAGYYLAKSGVCEVTVMVADRLDADGHVASQLSRINVPVQAGTSTRIYTSEGKALELSCSLSTKLMTVRPLEQTAFAVK